ncbi:hypothetical protein [Arthrobacter sp. AZCC_0090]|nr:hypothetical protein [Arthrobacter sp. AZCC_0090]MBB6404555.1 hypothetical protein [Arthrobacter sp. AZCC_0090]
MSNDIGRFSLCHAATPADIPAEEQEPAEPVYGSAGRPPEAALSPKPPYG